MRRALIPLFLLAAIVTVVLYWRRGAPATATHEGGGGKPSASPSWTSPASDPPPRSKAAQRASDRAKRDALRSQIVAQLAEHPPAPTADVASSSTSTSPPPPGSLQNKLGAEHQALVDHINHDFMPLADECIDQAKARTPGLTGMVGLGVETLSDDTHGGVIDAADLTAASTVHDPELLECIRESAYSLRIPSPLLNGREKFELTLRIDADDAGRP